MKLTLSIQMDNDAFKPSPGKEAARILRAAARQIEGCEQDDSGSFALMDVNGNKVGTLTLNS